MYEWTFAEIVARALIVFFVVIAATLISLYKGVKISINIIEDRAMKNEDIPVSIVINNKSFLPVMVAKIYMSGVNEFYNMSSVAEIDLPVPGWGKREYSFRLTAGSCGNLSVGITKIRLREWTGIFYVEKKVNSMSTVVVMPEYTEGTVEYPTVNNAVYIDSDEFSKDKPGDDPSEVFDIRQIRDGDSIHRVNWKVSAKKDTYMVNEYSLSLGTQIVIIVRNCIDKENVVIKECSIIDKILEKVLELSVSLQEYDIVHDIIWFDDKSKTYTRHTVMPDESVSQVFKKIYQSGLCTSSYQMISSYINQFDEEVFSHMYLVTGSNKKEEYMMYFENRENTIKHMFLPNSLYDAQTEYYCNMMGIELEEY